MRGKQVNGAPAFFGFRITPACAGKTDSRSRREGFCEDHPRVCGENAPISEALNSVSGSPPRVRGKLPLGPIVSKTLRITPACAGKTDSISKRRGINGDHPRVCGENVSIPRDIQLIRGSPPRVRGKLVDSFDWIIQGRITPACAGKTVCGVLAVGHN